MGIEWAVNVGSCLVSIDAGQRVWGMVAWPKSRNRACGDSVRRREAWSDVKEQEPVVVWPMSSGFNHSIPTPWVLPMF